ncbi:MAG TPA: hypothetical protein VK983_03700, partial [Candidatus Limnocylindrales bacterium]|nr:hypothetical protein [Candidatus Limnocylindrales bacterium]
RYYDVTLLVVTVAVLMAAFLWLPLQRRARDRSGIFLAQLMIALFISGPTLFLYGGMREAALQEMDRQFLFAIGAAPDGLPSFGSYTNYMFGPGLSPGVALGLWLLLISIPAFNYYRYTVSKQRILGFKMKTLFQ